jgi:hypothetical protein
MQKKFSKYFIRGELRKMRENVLFEREKMFLPALQFEAEKMIQIKKLTEKCESIRKKLEENDKNEDQLVRDQRKTQREYEAKLRESARLMTKLRYQEQKTPEKFIMKCVKKECKGFLSEQYKCGLCSLEICKHCHVEIGEEKHDCNKDDVESIKELMKSTKPCPKCNIRIYKIDGCDQMFCIQCHTAFSWKSGLEEKGVIHNPHYFEALREGNITVNRHREHQGECGPIPHYQEILRFINKAESQLKNRLDYMYRRLVHHRNTTLLELEQIDGTGERLKFLMNECDETEFKQKTYVRHQGNLRRIEERQIFVTFLNIGDELFRNLNANNVSKIYEEMNTLHKITKESFERLNMIYEHAGSKKIKYFLNEL